VPSSAGGYLWFIVLMVAMLTSGFPPRAQVVGSLAFGACAVALLVADSYLPKPQLAPGAERTILAVSYFATFAYVFAVLYFTVAQSRFMYRRLREESAKSESLLLNILPKDVAAILKEDQRTVAEQFGGASVLFADVVGFTPMTARMTPAELVALLNEVFICFDELVERHGLEKIKTIGDCYMVASGVPRARQDHAEVLVQMALEMRELMAARTFAGRRLLFRIGVNSGPVVAGVIGRKKFAYDLWGDAVNTASRMESHGTPGEIQITRSTYERVGERFVCEALGSIEIKGKGPMDVWRVAGPRAPSA
jgi:guanylate cyclase